MYQKTRKNSAKVTIVGPFLRRKVFRFWRRCREEAMPMYKCDPFILRCCSQFVQRTPICTTDGKP